jgi:hypothetical protein
MGIKFLDRFKKEAEEAGISVKKYMIKNNYCTICGKKFEPDIRNKQRCTYYITCSDCRNVARSKRHKAIITGTDSRTKLIESRNAKGLCIQCGKNPQSDARWTIGRYLPATITRPSNLCESCRQHNKEVRENWLRRGPAYYERIGYRSSSCDSNYNERLRERGLCYRCKTSHTRGDHVYCESCLEQIRAENRASYTPMYPEETLKKFKVGKKFPLTVTTKCRGDKYPSIVIASIECNDEGVPTKINGHDGSYYTVNRPWRYNRRNASRFEFTYHKVATKE